MLLLHRMVSQSWSSMWQLEDDGLDFVAKAANDLPDPSSGESMAALVARHQVVERYVLWRHLY